MRENVAPFIAMTPETFGVYANAVKETHWLSYVNYAAIVSARRSSRRRELGEGANRCLHRPRSLLFARGARQVISALLNAIYNRNGQVENRTLFLLDEVARPGYLSASSKPRVTPAANMAVSLLLLYQSIGQMRGGHGGRDASSKWFESASWIPFAAVNDSETADYISARCGDTTVEVDQVSRASQTSGNVTHPLEAAHAPAAHPAP